MSDFRSRAKFSIANSSRHIHMGRPLTLHLHSLRHARVSVLGSKPSLITTGLDPRHHLPAPKIAMEGHLAPQHRLIGPPILGGLRSDQAHRAISDLALQDRCLLDP